LIKDIDTSLDLIDLNLKEDEFLVEARQAANSGVIFSKVSRLKDTNSKADKKCNYSSNPSTNKG